MKALSESAFIFLKTFTMSTEQDPTIYSVAQKADVSISTVSRVLNAPHLVKKETRDKVLDAIDQLGFVPKAEAQAYAKKQLGRVGVLTPFFSHPSFVQRMRGVASVLASNSYELVIYPVESLNQIYHYLETVQLARRLDGLITMALTIDEETVQRYIRNTFPVAMIETQHDSINSVYVNNVAGGQLAAKYLLAKGYTSFGFIGDGDLPDYSLRPSDERLEGFTQILSENGIELDPDLVIHPTVHNIQAEIKGILNSHKRPGAIFAAYDELAMQTMMLARKKGLRIPEDLAVIGFDDLDFAEHFGLTTITQKLEESGRIAAELVLAQVKKFSTPVKSVELPLSIIERETA